MHIQARILGAAGIAIAAVSAIAAIPLMKRRKVPMNHFYGIRIPAAFKSQSHWHLINAYGGQQLLAWSIPSLFIGIAFFLLPALSQPQWLSLSALGLASPVVSVFFVQTASRQIRGLNARVSINAAYVSTQCANCIDIACHCPAPN